MKRKQKRLARLLVTAVLAALVWWAGDEWLVSKPVVERKPSTEADYSIDNFSATRLTKLGKPQHQLSASSYHFYSDNNTAQLIKPKLVQYDANQRATYTRADTGELNTSKKTLRMLGNVEVRKGRAKDRGPMQLETNELIIELK
ncbi:MAG: LPS export ABC transporter periplasmic protein LptC [Proteobacteria bacterium]|nr:LPS export ABC transporter periplasmic protein LptC [Pseudomonadota bacterium]